MKIARKGPLDPLAALLGAQQVELGNTLDDLLTIRGDERVKALLSPPQAQLAVSTLLGRYERSGINASRAWAIVEGVETDADRLAAGLEAVVEAVRQLEGAQASSRKARKKATTPGIMPSWTRER